MTTMDGIDVSHYQNQAGGSGANAINWNKVKTSGAKYCFVKISEAAGHDNFGPQNVSRARTAGLLVGGYHFLRNTASGAAQANAFLTGVTFSSGDLVPTLDIELIPSSAAARAAYVQKAKDWVAAVRSAYGGRWPFIYTRANIWSALGNPAGFGNCALWLARYSSTPPPIPSGFSSYVVWQFSQSGSVAGITGKVDLNSLAIPFATFKSNYTL